MDTGVHAAAVETNPNPRPDGTGTSTGVVGVARFRPANDAVVVDTAARLSVQTVDIEVESRAFGHHRPLSAAGLPVLKSPADEGLDGSGGALAMLEGLVDALA